MLVLGTNWTTILWSVNKLSRSVTKWTQACDKRLARLISYIHRTNDCRQYCHVGNTAQHCRLGLFQDSDFASDLEDSKSTSGGVLCILEAEHLFQSVGCARNRLQFHTVPQKLKSFRWMLDQRLPALDLWDIVIEVPRTINGDNQPGHTGSGKLEYVQPNLTNCDSKTKTERVN